MVVVRLIESDIVFCIDDEVTCVDVVTLHCPFKYFWLVNSSFLHEIYYLILYSDGMVYIVVQLHLELILKLPFLGQKVFLLNWISEIFVIFCEEIHFANMGP